MTLLKWDFKKLSTVKYETNTYDIDNSFNNISIKTDTSDIIFEKALYQASCKAAIKAGREYPEGHIKWLVDKLMEIPDITVCPHGRPVAMELSKGNIDRQFLRT